MAARLRFLRSREGWRGLIASKPPLRAFTESAFIGGLLALILSRFYGRIGNGVYTDYFVYITVFSVAFYAYRLHVLIDDLDFRVLFDATIGFGGGIFIGVLTLQVIYWVTPLAYSEMMMYHRLGITLTPFPLNFELGLFLSVPTFILARITKYLWRIWDRARRRYFVYELVHWFLMFVLLAGALAYAGYAIATDAVAGKRSIPVDLTRVREIFTLSNGLAVLLLAILFFPLTLFPYFISQRITQRIKNLADATSAIRAGSYDVRAEVRGEDEIAELQADFNAMADELQRTLNALESERNTVAELLKSRQALFASISHELRTPLSVLKGYLESALAGEAAEESALQADLEIMRRETLQLERLINDLFTLARAEVAQLELRLESVDLIPLLRNVVEAAKSLVWEKNRVEVVAELPANLAHAQADKSRLEQIVDNLIYNAVKHTPPGGAVIVSAGMDGDAVLIQVRDTGEGIPSDELPLVWERFYRTHDSREKRLPGTGLGLALVKELAEAMQGSVSVESEPGEGSCFSIKLPVIM